MASPTKKRKLNPDAKKASAPSRGLEFFFSRQKQGLTTPPSLDATTPASPLDLQQKQQPAQPAQQAQQVLTDEELARKLQAEWDAEDAVALPRSAPTAAAEPSLSRSRSQEAQPDTVDPENTKQGPSPAVQPNGKPKPFLSLSSAAATEDHVTTSIPLDESPLVFEPSKYTFQLQATWAADTASSGRSASPSSPPGCEASYALLARCFVLVASTTSRIKTIDTLVNCVRLLIEADPSSLLPAVWLATNAIAPPWSDTGELGLGGPALSRALRQVCGLDARALKALYHRLGDPGDVAFEAKKKQAFTLRRPKPLTIRGVYRDLVKVANTQGQGSAQAKQRIVDRLLQDARGGEESRYIVRTLCQHLRIGAVKTTMLIALSRAFLLSKPPGASFATLHPAQLAKLKKEDLAEIWGGAEETVKASFARRPDYDDLVPSLLAVGVQFPEALAARCGLALHIPLRPMLGNITRDLAEMLVKLQGRDFACEFKYDGQRAQVHCDARGRVSIFSRHLERMTDKYPDLVALVPGIRGFGGDDIGGAAAGTCGAPVESFILEGEVVAVDRATGELKNFQTLTNRARKDVAIGAITVDVCLFAFDLMYLDGRPLLDRPFRERRELLRTRFREVPNRFTWVRSIDATSQDAEAVLDFFRLAVDHKCEGIMVKILDDLPALDGRMDETGEEKGQQEQRKVSPGTETPNKGKGRQKKKSKNAKATVASADSDQQDQPQQLSPKPSRRKPLLATYEPDKRLDSWLKVKKDYSASSETLDLVPVAAWHGSGRKAKWWSPILLAVRNDETGSLEAVCKCMSGFTDAFYKANRAFYDDGSGEAVSGGGESAPDEQDVEENDDADEERTKTRGVVERRKNTHARKPAFVEYSGPEPAVWFEPQEVWETAFADVTVSPVYTAAIGLVREDRGLSLRFPRFLRVREDKGIDEATTSDYLATLYRKQEAKAPAAGAAASAASVRGEDGRQRKAEVEEGFDSGEAEDIGLAEDVEMLLE